MMTLTQLNQVRRSLALLAFSVLTILWAWKTFKVGSLRGLPLEAATTTVVAMWLHYFLWQRRKIPRAASQEDLRAVIRQGFVVITVLTVIAVVILT
jgi:hypothetical protein